MGKYKISEMKVAATPEEIINTYEAVLKKDDFMGEYGSCLEYLPYEFAKPYLKKGVSVDQWEQKEDADLVSDFEHYRDWWRQKVEDGRGISVHRGKAQFAIRMMLAGLPEWEDLFNCDGGYYQPTAYNDMAQLFGFEPITKTYWG